MTTTNLELRTARRQLGVLYAARRRDPRWGAIRELLNAFLDDHAAPLPRGRVVPLQHWQRAMSRASRHARWHRKRA